MPADRGGAGPDDDAPPPFLSWRAIYLLVLGALAAEVVAGIALSALLS
jgi:hypothetical protein